MVGKELYEVIFVAEDFLSLRYQPKSQVRSFQPERLILFDNTNGCSLLCSPVGVRIRDAILGFNVL
jgi:hypothetical protein